MSQDSSDPVAGCYLQPLKNRAVLMNVWAPCTYMVRDWHRGLSCPVHASVQAEILRRLPQDAKHLVRLLAAGQFDHEQAAWEAVLLEPVVMPLEASMSVQQIAQVTFDIAAAVDQLARLMILDCGISPKNIGIQDDGHGCLYDFGVAEVGLGQT